MPEINTQELIANILQAHGLKDVEELKTSSLWANALEQVRVKAGNRPMTEEAMKAKALEVLSVTTPERVSMEGFFIRNRPARRYVKEAKQWVDDGVHIQVLLTNGRLVEVPSGSGLPNAQPVQTRVLVQDLLRQRNLVNGYETLRPFQGAEGGTTVIVHPHEAPLPEVTLGYALKRVQGRDRFRNTILGKTSTLAVLTIGDARDIRFFGPKGSNDFDTIFAGASDAQGNPVSVKLPVDQVKAQFGTSKKEIARELAGELLVAYGTLSQFQRKIISKDSDAAAYAEIQTLLEYYVGPDGQRVKGLGLLRPAKKGSTKLALNLKGQFVTDESGRKAPATTVVIAGLDVYDIEDWGNGTYCLYTYNPERAPVLDTIERTITYKTGPNKDKQGSMNEGAFAIFVNRLLGKPKDTDPFVQAGRQSGLF